MRRRHRRMQEAVHPSHVSGTAGPSGQLRGASDSGSSSTRNQRAWTATVLLCGAVSGAATAWGFQMLRPPPGQAVSGSLPESLPAPGRAADLLAMPRDELAGLDIALVNLLCAAGLPGSEDLDVEGALGQLDAWAARVNSETERHLYRVTDPRYAAHYHHSEARLRAEFLVQVLQEDCGVRYNADRIDEPDFGDARDLFIHGMLPGGDGGTCASMPILYVAVGRRLGYPMTLVLAKQHVFCRWDGDGERFNIEGASDGGVNNYPDDHQQNEPHRR